MLGYCCRAINVEADLNRREKKYRRVCKVQHMECWGWGGGVTVQLHTSAYFLHQIFSSLYISYLFHRQLICFHGGRIPNEASKWYQTQTGAPPRPLFAHPPTLITGQPQPKCAPATNRFGGIGGGGGDGGTIWKGLFTIPGRQRRLGLYCNNSGMEWEEKLHPRPSGVPTWELEIFSAQPHGSLVQQYPPPHPPSLAPKAATKCNNSPWPKSQQFSKICGLSKTTIVTAHLCEHFDMIFKTQTEQMWNDSS